MASALVLFSQQQVCSFRLSKTFLKKERKKKRVRSKPAEGLWELLQPAWLHLQAGLWQLQDPKKSFTIIIWNKLSAWKFQLCIFTLNILQRLRTTTLNCLNYVQNWKCQLRSLALLNMFWYAGGSCDSQLHMHAHALIVYGSAFSPVWQLKLTFNRFHGDQNKEFLYWQHSHSQTQYVLFYLNIEGTFMAEEQAPTPSRALPDASMSWLIFFLHGNRPTSCQSLFASHQITFWRWWWPNNIFACSELISLPPDRLKKEMRCHCPFVALPTVAAVKKCSSKLSKSSYLISDQIFVKITRH